MSGMEEWMQFDVGQVRAVYAIVTQGHEESPDWVTAYKMMFLTESSTWTTYTDVLGNEMVGLKSELLLHHHVKIMLNVHPLGYNKHEHYQ